MNHRLAMFLLLSATVSLAKEPPPSPSMQGTAIKIYRPGRFMCSGSGDNIPVIIDDKEVGRIQSGRFFTVRVAPGTHSARGDETPPVQVEVKKDQVAFIRFRFDHIGGTCEHDGVGVALIAPDAAQHELAGLKPSDAKYIYANEVAPGPVAPELAQAAPPSKSTAMPAASPQRGLSTETAGQGAVAGSSYALIIGIDRYTQFPQLHTAVKDAKAVEAILRQDYGFQTQLLLDEQADRGHIMTLMSRYRRTLTPDSNLLIYYAGHGIHDRESDKVYWLPVDAEPDNSANWLLTDDITSEIRAIPARHILVVADSCYAGGMTREAESLFTPEEHSRFLEKMASARSRDLLSSGGDEPVADAGGLGDHSVFAAAMLKGLESMQVDEFTGSELFSSYIRIAVAGQSEQAPEYTFIRNSGHDAGDFVFVRRKP